MGLRLPVAQTWRCDDAMMWMICQTRAAEMRLGSQQAPLCPRVCVTPLRGMVGRDKPWILDYVQSHISGTTLIRILSGYREEENIVIFLLVASKKSKFLKSTTYLGKAIPCPFHDSNLFFVQIGPYVTSTFPLSIIHFVLS